MMSADSPLISLSSISDRVPWRGVVCEAFDPGGAGREGQLSHACWVLWQMSDDTGCQNLSSRRCEHRELRKDLGQLRATRSRFRFSPARKSAPHDDRCSFLPLRLLSSSTESASARNLSSRF